ncbi:DNA-(apurinic or apyrimidinic site) lyase [Candidatus Magnetoovum chiemensis]|nr:DNA-(apurinic or apyrimidinic site) lyase [Candidatus Magnetoovum chiemensis]
MNKRETAQLPNFDINNAISLIKEHVKTLKVPYIEAMAKEDRDPFKILISCILSLRTQDNTTAAASQRLFALASTPKNMSELNTKDIENAIYPVGFYRVKAGNIKEISNTIIKDYDGKVPGSIEELIKLKGVGRKTANLVVTMGYNKYGICVDTHVHRITNRWGYIKTDSPLKTEQALRETLPLKYWKEINGLLVPFGQGICRPIKPACDKCSIKTLCFTGKNCKIVVKLG